jgi:hypothetical protein
MKSPLIFLILLIIFSCKNLNENFPKEEIFKIDMENCNAFVDLKLSDLIDSCGLVKLETTKECVLGQYLNGIYVSDKFIIIDDRNGIYKFSIDGRFIKKIISDGRGPHEISSSINSFFDRRSNLLYIDESMRRNSFLNVYNVESEIFLEPVKKCFSETWGSYIIYHDSLIIGSIFPGVWGSLENITMADTLPYAFFVQNLKGKFISGVPSNRKFMSFQTTFVQRANIIAGDKDIYIKYVFDDTLFKFRDGKLLPYILPIYSNPKSDLPSDSPNIGDKQIYYSEYENSSYSILWESIHDSRTRNGPATTYNYKYNYFFINKSNGKYYKIGSYTDDLIGQVQKGEGGKIVFPTFLQDNKLYVLYNPFELINKKNDEVTNHQLPDTIYKQLQKIRDNSQATDNPVLLIGTIKRIQEIK